MTERPAQADPSPSPRAGFAATQWSVVLAARGDPATRRAALEQLCRQYWPPVYGYLRRRGESPADAQDLTQGFFAHLLQNDFLARPDPDRGRFRGYLIGALKQFVGHARVRDGAQKRGGGRPCGGRRGGKPDRASEECRQVCEAVSQPIRLLAGRADPATVVECCEVALLLRERLADDGLTGHPKTSGSKGLQLYAPLRPTSSEQTRAYALSLASRLGKERPDVVVSDMTKSLRRGKVFIDWSQNAAAKTTVAPYSLRARPEPTVSTPVTWDEVSNCRRVEDPTFVADDVLRRLDERGDLLADLVELPSGRRARLPSVPTESRR